MARPAASRLATLGLALGGVAAALLLAEVAVRAYSALAAPRPPGVPRHVACDCPYLYEPNPAHPDHGTQGLRDEPVAIPKPADVSRILVLGDSVTYGAGVAREHTFPARLEARLAGRARPVEVVNAAVSGYTTWNEVEWYLARGRGFEPDVVVLALCLNDVVNPRLHWDFTGEALPDVPEAAIPNPRYDRQRIQPLLARSWSARELARAHPSRLRRFQLVAFVESRLRGRATWEDLSGTPEQRSAPLAGRRWPTYLTLEDPLSIQVLLDWDSPEWQWLRHQLDRLHQAVRADGAELALLVLPLGYQLEPGYPFAPQARFERYCAERGIPCLDPLSRLRALGPAGAFLRDRAADYDDVWHLTEGGHDAVAALLAEELERPGWLPPHHHGGADAGAASATR